MNIHSIQFKGFSCFKDQWSEIPSLKPICIIIGKNNTGKSHYLQMIENLCSNSLFSIRDIDFIAEAILDESSMNQYFNAYRKQYFINKIAVLDSSLNDDNITIKDDQSNTIIDLWPGSQSDHIQYNKCISRMFQSANHTIKNRKFLKLLADRDIQPEETNNDLELLPNGNGATNIIRKYINSTNPDYPRELIRNDMLKSLNFVFGEDGHFEEITIQHIDGNDRLKADDLWEVYLKQKDKGLIALSQSGSSLKTVFLVLLNIIIIPKIQRKKLSEFVFAFEELENNLHPSLLRRLLNYLETHIRNKAPHSAHSHPIFFLTTHSNVALDYFAGRKHAQIVHITHCGKSAKAELVSQSSQQLEVLKDLGSKPSDLLQANGIIWVEGPSDRIYINKWIELWSDGEFEEGRHYQCMFYGGGLIANLDAAYKDEELAEFINLLTINPNVIVVTDSDRKSKNAHFKPRVKRIRDSFKKLNENHAFHWLLEAREIENYLTGDLINHALTKKMNSPKDPKQFESFFPKQSETTNYLESKAKRKSIDKSELAMITTKEMNKTDLTDRFDLDRSMEKIISMIREWNK